MVVLIHGDPEAGVKPADASGGAGRAAATGYRMVRGKGVALRFVNGESQPHRRYNQAMNRPSVCGDYHCVRDR